MIRFKLGLPDTAVGSLALYAAAALQANLVPPPLPAHRWRGVMDRLAAIRAPPTAHWCRRRPSSSTLSARHPRGGARAAAARLMPDAASCRRRHQKPARDPWIFAWSQNRLMLPAWLGAGEALEQLAMAASTPCSRRCTARGRSSPRVSACWRWCSRRPMQSWPVLRRAARGPGAAAARRTSARAAGARYRDGPVDLARRQPDGRRAGNPRVGAPAQHLHRSAEPVAGRAAAPLPRGPRRAPRTGADGQHRGHRGRLAHTG